VKVIGESGRAVELSGVRPVIRVNAIAFILEERAFARVSKTTAGWLHPSRLVEPVIGPARGRTVGSHLQR